MGGIRDGVVLRRNIRVQASLDFSPAFGASIVVCRASAIMAGATRWEVASGKRPILEPHTASTLCLLFPRGFASSNMATIFTIDRVGRGLSEELPTDGALILLIKATKF